MGSSLTSPYPQKNIEERNGQDDGSKTREIIQNNVASIITIVLIVATIIFFINYQFFRLTIAASLALSLIVAYIVLLTMYPLGSLMYQRSTLVIVIYLLIVVGVPFVLLIYLFILLNQTKRPLDSLDEYGEGDMQPFSYETIEWLRGERTVRDLIID